MNVCAGVLLGIAIRTGSPLSLNLAEPVWKQLAGMNLTIADLSEVGDPQPVPTKQVQNFLLYRYYYVLTA